MWGENRDCAGDMDEGESVGGDENGADGHWALDCYADADVGDCTEDGVEQEPELEHDVSRSTR